MDSAHDEIILVCLPLPSTRDRLSNACANPSKTEYLLVYHLVVEGQAAAAAAGVWSSAPKLGDAVH
jgi:hypothetical protein